MRISELPESCKFLSFQSRRSLLQVGMLPFGGKSFTKGTASYAWDSGSMSSSPEDSGAMETWAALGN